MVRINVGMRSVSLLVDVIRDACTSNLHNKIVRTRRRK
jgi:hypothetical protein